MSRKILFSLLIVFCLAIIYSRSEAKFIFYPEIDTIFASGYSKDKFDAVQVGTPQELVVQMLGEPFSKNGSCWQYSKDGKLWPYADFSYFLYQICFTKNGIVESKPVIEFNN